MTIRNLDHLFKPKSIALIGASKRPQSVGAVIARNLFHAGFDGPVMPVNPKHQAIEGVLTYSDVASLPLTPDLAVITTPPKSVPGIVGELAARGTKAAVVISAGFGEGNEASGAELRQAMLDAAKPHVMRIVGPNCLGIVVPGLNLNASFVHLDPLPGTMAFVSQSGAVATSVVDWATARGIGFSHVVSLGDMADVDFGDMLDFLTGDPGTRSILLYIEAISDARKFMSAGRAAARIKPVVVVKAGRHAEGARAATSHTGALAGSDAVYDTAFRRAGMLRVVRLEELFDAVQTLAVKAPPKGDRLAIVTNGGGVGVMATDMLIELGGRLAEFGPETIAKLDRVLPPTWSKTNPVDIIGDAPAGRYADALDAVLADKNVDGILVINCPTAVASSTDAAQAVVEKVGRRPRLPVLTSWLGAAAAVEARHIFAEHRLPTYRTPEDAVTAFMEMVDYQRNQTTLMETPPSITEELAPDADAASAIIESARAAGRQWLTEPESKDLLAAHGVPVARARFVQTAKEAAAAAAEIGGPVVVKIVSPDIIHKTDVGGVALDLDGPKIVEDTATAMLERARKARPDATIEGFSVQPMIRRRRAFELIIGMLNDRKFGPMLLFGHGGTAVELVDDKALALPPLNLHLAREVMARTRIYRLLEGYRDRPAANLDDIAATLIKVSQLVIDRPEIEELDINPLLADADGVIALDVRVKLTATAETAGRRLAIRPYPKELEETVQLDDGRELLLRPVVPEDEPALHRTFAALSPEEVRLRFFSPLKTLSHDMAARFTQIDYDREMALVLADPGIPGTVELYGGARIIADPDNERAEYAIIVRREMAGRGLGTFLMRRIIDYGRSRGIGTIFGDVLRENRGMLKVCDALGFVRSSLPDDPAIVRVTFEL